jgi:K+-transporting ATPase KdpF subunit
MCAAAKNCGEGNEMSIGTIVILAVCFLLLIYLTVALLRPEKF